MEAEVAAALWQLEAAFVAHQAREVLESLTPRQKPVVLAEADPLALALEPGDGPTRLRAALGVLAAAPPT